MKFYSKCSKCNTCYHISNAFGCPKCSSSLLIQVELIDHEIKQLRKRRAELMEAYEREVSA